MSTETIGDLPLFPLATVLFPQGLLPLRIFEVRYLHMIAACQRAARPFGVVSLLRGSEVEKAGDAGPEVFQGLGTLAQIVEFAAPMPGLMQVHCLGGRRFRIQRQEKQRQGLWVAQVECIEPDPAVPVPEHLAAVAQRLGKLIRGLQQQGAGTREMPFRPPYQLDDCGWVANRWAEILPLPASTRQDLLALENPLLRLELIGDVLDRMRPAP